MRTRTLVLVVLSLSAIFLSACGQDSGEEILSDPLQECQRVEGSWVTFGNSCAKRCDFIRTVQTGTAQVVCVYEYTDSCNCGPGRCWNGNTCEDIV